jgi:hypothetical protein
MPPELTRTLSRLLLLFLFVTGRQTLCGCRPVTTFFEAREGSLVVLLVAVVLYVAL